MSFKEVYSVRENCTENQRTTAVYDVLFPKVFSFFMH